MKDIKEKKKYFIIGGISLVLIIIAIVAVVILTNIDLFKTGENSKKQLPEPREFTIVSKDGTEINKSEQLIKDKTYEGLNIVSSKLQSTEKSTELTVEFKNNTDKKVDGHTVKITMLDKEGNKISSVNGYLGTMIPGETYKMFVSSSGDFVNAYDYIVEKA